MPIVQNDATKQYPNYMIFVSNWWEFIELYGTGLSSLIFVFKFKILKSLITPNLSPIPDNVKKIPSSNLNVNPKMRQLTSIKSGQKEKDIKLNKIPWVTHGEGFTSPNPWVTHMHGTDLRHLSHESLMGVNYVFIQWRKFSESYNVSSLLYMGMIYVYFINESKILSNWF